MYRMIRLRSACESVQPDQSLRLATFGIDKDQIFNRRTAKKFSSDYLTSPADLSLR